MAKLLVERREASRAAPDAPRVYHPLVVRKKRRPQTAYRIIYAPEVDDHLSRFTKRGQTMILDAVLRQLGHEPTVPTRNRKPLEANPLAPWELRIGEYRVYFDVKEEPERVVRIVAVGLKDRDRVLVGGIEVKLR